MSLSKHEIDVEWQSLPKHWYAIYQWKRTTGVSYTEWISELIAASFSQIQLITTGLRERLFRTNDHRGQISLGTGIEQLTEKRIVRAMFNATNLQLLGRTIDYEIPLKQTDDAEHGDIDLLCELPNTVLCLETKKPNSGESILKAILQAYAYTSLVSTKKNDFLTDFALSQELQLTPAVLTFASAQSSRQLKNLKAYPQLVGLIRILNNRLIGDGIAPMRFFVVENSDTELERCLSTTTAKNADVKAVFREGFKLSISEYAVS